MLDDAIVLKNCYYWAKRLICRGVDFDALVSVGYIVGKPLKDPRLLKDWIYHSMIHFIVNEIKNRQQCTSLEPDSYLENVSEAVEHFQYDDLHQAIANAGLSNRDISILKMFFFDGKNQSEIAALIFLSQPVVSIRLSMAIAKVGIVYKRGLKV